MNSPGAPYSALVFLAAALLSGPARAEEGLSDTLTHQILETHRHSMDRRLHDDFEQQKAALGTVETPERAVKLRALLKIEAETFEMLEEYDRTEVALTAALAVRPVDPVVFADRGYYYMRLGRFAEAAEDFLAGSRLAPKQAAYSYGAARAFARLGDHERALQHYDEALRLAPNNAVALLGRAEALARLNRFAEARAAYDVALDLGLRRADTFFVYFGRGYANIALGDFDGAIQDMDAALALRPNVVHAVVWRGFAREKIGDRHLALADYEAAERMSPNDKWIRASIRRVRS